MIIKGKDVRLPKRFKAKWLKALRSGDYKQGKSALHNKTDNTYCCLGVAAVVCGHKPEELITKGLFVEGHFDTIALNNLKVPKLLIGYNDSTNPIVTKLTRMNDSGKHSFKSIAAYIERYL